MTRPGRENSGGESKTPRDSKSQDPLLRIVRAQDPKSKDDDLDLDLELDEFEGDRRYGREDIADK